MKNVLILSWMIWFLMWTIANSCPNPPDSTCDCEGHLPLNIICYSTETNEKIFQAKQHKEEMKGLELWCEPEKFLDTYFDVRIPVTISIMIISNCLFTAKWARNALNSSVDTLEIWKQSNIPSKGSIALFRMLPNLRVLYLLQIKVLHLSSYTFKYTSNLDILAISSSNIQIMSNSPFIPLQNLKILQLYDNKIKSLPDTIFQDLPFLIELMLSNCKLETLPENLFVKNINLKYLDLSRNSLIQLPQNLLQYLKNLVSFNVKRNPLRQVPSDFFKNNIKLSEFKANQCNLTSLPKNLFENAENLTHIFMRANKLNFITNNYFRSNTLLWYLDLSSNEISQLIDSPFRHNTKLEKLFLKGNKLLNIARKDFFDLKLLYELDISDNLISNIEETCFYDLINLDVLTAQRNRLKFIKADYFKTNAVLRKLDLSYNEISQLINSPFRFNTELRELLLNGNELNYISRSDFFGLRTLNLLNISYNSLTQIEEFSFEDMLKLRTFDVSQNFLKEIPHLHHAYKTLSLSLFIANDNNILKFPNITKYKKLKELRLEKNKITSLSIPRNLFPAKRSTYIYLQNNSIETVYVDSIKFDHDHDYDYDDMINRPYLRKKVLFHFEGNPLICDCDLYEFNEYISRNVFCLHHVLFSDAHRLTCKGPQNLKGKIITKLHKDAFVCPVIEKCPAGCRCTFRKSDSAVIMHCDALEMNTLPKVISENINILHIENNRLIDLNELEREEWHNLTELYVDGNRLSAKNSAQWYIPRNLRVLSLTGNNLNCLPEPIRHHAEKMTIFRIYLRNNSWRCDCSGADLRHWIHEHVVQVKDMNEILCTKDSGDGSNSTFLELMKLTHDYLCPFDHYPFIRERIVGASVILTLGFICVISIIFYNMNKRMLLSYIYIHFPLLFKYLYKREDLDSEKTFDAFISYSSDDRDVAIEISNELENKEPYYKLCIHERDWMAGGYITENIVSSVESSRKTILIISKSFLESRWCDLEFDVAYNQTLKDKLSRLILIVKGDLPLKKIINGDLRFMLTTRTYITWGEGHFWQNLRSALSVDFRERNSTV